MTTTPMTASESFLDTVPRSWIRAALLQMWLRDMGRDVTERPPLLPTGHTWFTVDGRRMSMSAIEALRRVVALRLAHCAGCGQPVNQAVSRNGRERGLRLDVRYCSNACRQRAYRQHAASASVPETT
jgi:hypothetical protein